MNWWFEGRIFYYCISSDASRNIFLWLFCNFQICFAWVVINALDVKRVHCSVRSLVCRRFACVWFSCSKPIWWTRGRGIVHPSYQVYFWSSLRLWGFKKPQRFKLLQEWRMWAGWMWFHNLNNKGRGKKRERDLLLLTSTGEPGSSMKISCLKSLSLSLQGCPIVGSMACS